MSGQPRLRPFHQLNSALSVQPPVLVPVAGEVRVPSAECPLLVDVLRVDPPALRDEEVLPVELLLPRLVRCDAFEVADWLAELREVPVLPELPLDRLLPELPLDRLLPELPLDRLLPELPLERVRPLRVEPVERLVVRELVAEPLARLVELSDSPLSLEPLPQMSPEGKPPMRFAT
ncbi:hypothetical protein ACFO0H_03900 [Haloarchaeobius iranensis]